MCTETYGGGPHCFLVAVDPATEAGFCMGIIRGRVLAVGAPTGRDVLEEQVGPCAPPSESDPFWQKLTHLSSLPAIVNGVTI